MNLKSDLPTFYDIPLVYQPYNFAHTSHTKNRHIIGSYATLVPAGIVPYQIYNLKDTGNMTDILNRNGYKTTAIHPEYKGN